MHLNPNHRFWSLKEYLNKWICGSYAHLEFTEAKKVISLLSKKFQILFRFKS